MIVFFPSIYKVDERLNVFIFLYLYFKQQQKRNNILCCMIKYF